MRPARIVRQWDRPDFETPFPAQWERRLREVSPITDKTSHLRARLHPGMDGEQRWVLYSCIPKALLDWDRIHQFQRHHTELPIAKAFGRRMLVSEYQFYMYHRYGVDVRPCWVCQGGYGGTPFSYTEREEKLLQDMGECAECPPVGLLPYAPFDETVVAAVRARDRLLRYGHDMDALERSQTPEALAREQAETEKIFRKQFLGWWMESMKPMSEFMAWYTRRTEAAQTMRRATKAEANSVSQFQDHFIETGQWQPA